MIKASEKRNFQIALGYWRDNDFVSKTYSVEAVNFKSAIRQAKALRKAEITSRSESRYIEMQPLEFVNDPYWD
jgi:hypothetical protein